MKILYLEFFSFILQWPILSVCVLVDFFPSKSDLDHSWPLETTWDSVIWTNHCTQYLFSHWAFYPVLVFQMLFFYFDNINFHILKLWVAWSTSLKLRFYPRHSNTHILCDHIPRLAFSRLESSSVIDHWNQRNRIGRLDRTLWERNRYSWMITLTWHL